MKIAVYAIAKNEAKHVERFTAAVREADLVSVVDTGSTDGTQDLLRAAGARVHAVTPIPVFRFDECRNQSLYWIPDDVDVCISLDLDDVPQPGWRSAIEEAWKPGVVGLRYLYVTSHKADGLPDVAFHADKIHSRHGHHWEYPVHEVLVTEVEGRRETCAMTVDHRPDDSKLRTQYLQLLELAVEEAPDDHRMSFYLAREYMYRGMDAESCNEFRRFLELPGATWIVECGAATRWAARGYLRQGLRDAAFAWLFRSLSIAPDERETWIDLAQLYHDAGNFEGGYFAAGEALKITERPEHHCTESYAWRERADDLASVCAWQMGLRTRAYEHVQRAFAMAPNDERLAGNVKFMMYRSNRA